MKSALARLRCRVRGHEWVNASIAVDGAIATIPRCSRCAKIDVERIVVENWNRKARRQAARRIAGDLVDRAGRSHLS